MLSQANINKVLKERVLSKTAADGDPWYDRVKNWATADNYSNLKNVGKSLGATVLRGGIPPVASTAAHAARGLRSTATQSILGRGLRSTATQSILDRGLRPGITQSIWGRGLRSTAVKPAPAPAADKPAPAPAPAASPLNKMAADEGKWYDRVTDWARENDYSNLKDVGMGVGTAAATYGLTSLLPNSHKHKGKRLASAILAGAAAGYYGKDIRDYVESKAHAWRGNTTKQQETADFKQKAIATENRKAELDAQNQSLIERIAARLAELKAAQQETAARIAELKAAQQETAVSPPMPKVQPVTIPPMPKVLPITPATKAKAQADRDIETLKGKPSYGALQNLIASAKDTRPGPTLQNAARLEAARAEEIEQESQRRQRYREVIKNLRSKINDPVPVATSSVPGPSREEVAASNAARKAALAKKKKKEQELKNKAIADEYAKRVHAQADAPYVPAPTYEEVRRAAAKQQQKLTQDALRRGR